MKKGCILLLLMSVMSFPLVAQDIMYSSLKQFLAQKGDTVADLRIEKRSRGQILLSGGADYRIHDSDNEVACKLLKKKNFAVRTNNDELFVNIHKLRYKKMRFGHWYAPAIQLGKDIYFCAMPMGSVIGHDLVDADNTKLGGDVGNALATSSLVTKRVCYVINGETGKVDFVGKDKMLQLLQNHPEWEEEYLQRDSQEADDTFMYIQMLKEGGKRK